MKYAAVSDVLNGIKRNKGVNQTGKAPLLTVDVRRLIGVISEGLLGTRDAAMRLLGFAGGFRRSEIAALRVDDIEFGSDGLTVTLRRSKTDQEGAGRKVGFLMAAIPGRVLCALSFAGWMLAQSLKVRFSGT